MPNIKCSRVIGQNYLVVGYYSFKEGNISEFGDFKMPHCSLLYDEADLLATPTRLTAVITC